MEAANNYSSSSSTYPEQQAHARLHSVRKPQSKPWNKKPIAPLPPTPPRVYKVDPVNFRDLVQKLTGAPKYQTQRLRKMAPPPLDDVVLADHRQQQPGPPVNDQSSANANISLEFNMLSSPLSWCSFPLLSPETLSTLDQTRTSTVL